MSKISYILRPANAIGEHPIAIKHTHSNLLPFVKSVGVSVIKDHFDVKTGKVSNKHPHHVKLNAAIEQVRTDVELAADHVRKWEEPLDRATIGKEYNAIVNGRAKTIENRIRIKEVYTDFAEQLRVEIAELQSQLKEKQDELRDYELTLGSFQNRMLVTFIEKYRDTQKITDNTKRAYNNLLKYIKDFDKHWQLVEVTPETLINFEDYLIGIRLNNSSINTYIKRIKTVCLKYADTMQLNKQALKDHRTESKQLKKSDVLFLSTNELELFKAVETSQRREVVKDAFLLMCATGLRFSDHMLTKNNIKGDYIILKTQKTKTLVKIPINDSARAILEKYDYTMPYQYLANFARVLKILAKRAGIDELVHVQKIIGAEIVEGYVEKHTLISAHVGRKTFISHALAGGVNPAVLKQWIGHSKMELMFSNYASGQMNTIEEMEKVKTI